MVVSCHPKSLPLGIRVTVALFVLSLHFGTVALQEPQENAPFKPNLGEAVQILTLFEMKITNDPANVTQDVKDKALPHLKTMDPFLEILHGKYLMWYKIKDKFSGQIVKFKHNILDMDPHNEILKEWRAFQSDCLQCYLPSYRALLWPEHIPTDAVMDKLFQLQKR